MTDIVNKVVDINDDEREKPKEASMNSVLRNLAIIGSCVDQYTWTDKFNTTEIKEAMEKITKVGAKLNLPSLSNEELIDLGFRWWSDPNEKGESLLLIPLYFLKSLPEGTEIWSIGLGYGEKSVIGTDQIDNDVRMGMIPYGFVRKREPVGK